MSEADKIMDDLVAAAQAARKSRSLTEVDRLETLCWHAKRQLTEELARAGHNKWRKAVGLPEIAA